jgi:hypothetical protein
MTAIDDEEEAYQTAIFDSRWEFLNDGLETSALDPADPSSAAPVIELGVVVNRAVRAFARECRGAQDAENPDFYALDADCLRAKVEHYLFQHETALVHDAGQALARLWARQCLDVDVNEYSLYRRSDDDEELVGYEGHPTPPRAWPNLGLRPPPSPAPVPFNRAQRRAKRGHR